MADEPLEPEKEGLFEQMFRYGRGLRGKVDNKKIFQEKNVSSVLFTMSLALAVAVRKIFREKAEVRLSKEPVIEKKVITHFMKRMRIDPMEKFNAPAVVSAVHFYRNAEQMDKRKTLGVLLVYVELAYVSKLLDILKYPEIDDDEDEQVEDACGAICNIIAGYFKKELRELGYPDLEMSNFDSYINSVPSGFEYPQKATHKYEIAYEIFNKKRLVTEMVMLPITRATI